MPAESGGLGRRKRFACADTSLYAIALHGRNRPLGVAFSLRNSPNMIVKQSVAPRRIIATPYV